MSLGSHSLRSPTPSELEKMARAKNSGCVACYLGNKGFCGGVEYNHIVVNGRRAGHRFGYAIGRWHHQAVPLLGYSAAEMRKKFGPALKEGSKPFHERYGSDQFLFDTQHSLLGLPPERIARERGPGIGKPSKKTGSKNGQNCQRPSKVIPRGNRIF